MGGCGQRGGEAGGCGEGAADGAGAEGRRAVQEVAEMLGDVYRDRGV